MRMRKWMRRRRRIRINKNKNSNDDKCVPLNASVLYWFDCTL